MRVILRDRTLGCDFWNRMILLKIAVILSEAEAGKWA